MRWYVTPTTCESAVAYPSGRRRASSQVATKIAQGIGRGAGGPDWLQTFIRQFKRLSPTTNRGAGWMVMEMMTTFPIAAALPDRRSWR